MVLQMAGTFKYVLGTGFYVMRVEAIHIPNWTCGNYNLLVLAVEWQMVVPSLAKLETELLPIIREVFNES